MLRALDPDDRAAIEEALSYPEESAGRLMRRDAVAVPEHWTVGEVIDYLRAGDDLTTDFWEVFVVDPAHQPVGTCLLSWILRTPRRIAVADVMKREQTLIPVDMDQEEVALRFQKYALISAAVVDQAGPAGRHDHRRRHRPHHPGGSERGRAAAVRRRREGDINEPVLDSYKARVRWLVANLGTALVASTIICLFDGGDRADGGARRADADRRRRRRQCRHPDAGGDGARAGHQPAHPLQHAGARSGARSGSRCSTASPSPSLIGSASALVFGNPLLGGGDRRGDADQHRDRRPCRRGRCR